MSLATITALVDDKLRSTSLGGSYDTAARDRAIGQALVQYSQDEPQALVADAAASGYTLAVPANWVAGRSRLQAVEYPLDQVPMATVEAQAYHQASGWAIVLAQSLNAAVRLHYTAPHAADGSTVPDHRINAVACWAAAELCRQYATARAHDRDATIGAQVAGAPTESGELSRRAAEWLAVYRVALGLPDPNGRNGGAVVGGQPAGAVVSWGERRPRGRFYSA